MDSDPGLRADPAKATAVVCSETMRASLAMAFIGLLLTCVAHRQPFS